MADNRGFFIRLIETSICVETETDYAYTVEKHLWYYKQSNFISKFQILDK